MIFDANVIGNTFSGYEKSRASITNCILHFKEERRRSTKRRSKLQEIEREVRICRVTEITKGETQEA